MRKVRSRERLHRQIPSRTIVDVGRSIHRGSRESRDKSSDRVQKPLRCFIRIFRWFRIRTCFDINQNRVIFPGLLICHFLWLETIHGFDLRLELPSVFLTCERRRPQVISTRNILIHTPRLPQASSQSKSLMICLHSMQLSAYQT